jgi:hypothetical protein
LIGASNVDTDVPFSDVSDFLLYLPRALQIGLTAPFPSLWNAEGSTKVNSLMRRVAAFEMCAVYLALIFVPYALWLYRRKVEIWLAFTFSIILMLVYTYSMPNIGTLYRTRYGFLMTLVGIGIVGGIAAWNNFRNTLNLTRK